MRERIRDRERLKHILDAIERVQRYTQGKTYDDLVADSMMYYAVVKNIEIMGEAANMLTSDFVCAHPQTPWKMVRGMRNYIVHEYFQIDDIVVWDVVEKNIPELKQQILGYLEDMDSEDEASGLKSTDGMLRVIVEYFKTKPIQRAWLFGSYARGEERPDSNVNILVEFIHDSSIGLLEYARIKGDLENKLGRNVDLVEEGTLKPFALESVNRDKQLIYERI